MTDGVLEEQAAERPCIQCERDPKYCVCDFISPLSTKTKVVILQHPQEPGVDIGTVPIIKALLPNSIVRTGLSWPNLKTALGREASPQKWGVLYVGSVQVEALPQDRSLFVVDKKGVPLVEQDKALRELEGVVLLDGTWSQAKTLWWRNAWLLKLRRLVVRPSYRSRYDRIRREPRRGCLSTLETVGEVLQALEARDDILPEIAKPLEELVRRLSTAPRRQARGASGSRRRYRSRSRRPTQR
jgi:DTW domain-containing protein YfiP